MKKLLFISSEFPPGPGGIGNHAWNLCKELNVCYRIDVLTVSNYVTQVEFEQFDQKQNFYVYRFKNYLSSIKTYYYRISDIATHIKKNNYSYCILSGKFSLFCSFLIRFFSKEIKIIGVFHGSELLPKSILINQILNYCLKKINIYISVSNYTNNLIPIKLNEKSNRFIIPNGLNINWKKNYSINNNLNISGIPSLLTVGSITNRKGQINMIKALPKIIQNYPNIHYHCVGLNLESKGLIDIAKELNIEDYISLHGFVPNEQLFSIYKKVNILIMLSQNNDVSSVEGFGISILEANLFGIPAIGSINTGIEDSIQDGKTGVLVNPYSSRDILDAIDFVLNNQKRLSNNAIKWAKMHNWKDIGKKYSSVLENA